MAHDMHIPTNMMNMSMKPQERLVKDDWWWFSVVNVPYSTNSVEHRPSWDSRSCSQELLELYGTRIFNRVFTGPYSEPVEYSRLLSTLFTSDIHFSIIVLSMPIYFRYISVLFCYPCLFTSDTFQYYPTIHVCFFTVVSSLQAFRSIPCMHFSTLLCVLHVQDVSRLFFLKLLKYCFIKHWKYWVPFVR
jgi:hypothetical protein